MTKIAIVNDEDEIIGSAEKEEARANGWIHRLVRIVIVNSRGEILLQKRHPKAKDAPNKWDYAVAGHVDEGEDYLTAAVREAREELGLGLVDLQPIFKFYAEKILDGQHIRRFNTVFLARTDESIRPNLNELGGIKWFSKAEVEKMLHDNTDDFSSGFASKYEEIKPYLLI